MNIAFILAFAYRVYLASRHRNPRAAHIVMKRIFQAAIVGTLTFSFREDFSFCLYMNVHQAQLWFFTRVHPG